MRELVYVKAHTRGYPCTQRCSRCGESGHKRPKCPLTVMDFDFPTKRQITAILGGSDGTIVRLTGLFAEKGFKK